MSRWVCWGLAAVMLVVGACAPGPHPSVSPPAPPQDGAFPWATLDGFDAAFESAVDAAAGALGPAGDAVIGTPPACQASGGSAAVPGRICSIQPPGDPGAPTVVAVSGGARLFATLLLLDADADESRPVEDLGDEAVRVQARLGDACRGRVAARTGTLAVVVDVDLGDPIRCRDAVVPPGVEEAVRTLLSGLEPWAARGAVVDDPAARARVVDRILAGELVPGDRDVVDLPAPLANVSDSGTVVAVRDGEAWTIVFFEARGILDNYEGWIFRTSGRLEDDDDPLGGWLGRIERLDEHWFRVAAG